MNVSQMFITRKSIKTRKIHPCSRCRKPIQIGTARTEREVYKTCGTMLAYNSYLHIRCAYKKQQSELRFQQFQMHCTHPEKFIDTEYRYVPGEFFMEPDFDRCELCGKKLDGE